MFTALISPGVFETALAQFQSAGREIPFRSAAWLGAWATHYLKPGQPGKLFAIAVYDDSELVGIAPFYLDQSVRHGKLLRLLGDGEVCTDYGTILTRAGFEDAVSDSIARFLTDHDREWDTLVLDGVDADDSACASFVDKMQAYGNSTDTVPGTQCWRLQLPATWDEIYPAMSRTLRRQIRKLNSISSERFTFRTADSADSLAEGLDILVNLHQRRWEAKGKAGCFSSPVFQEFLFDAAQRLMEGGNLDLSWVEYKGQPAAIHFNVISPSAIFGYQRGLDPAHLDLEPGKALHINTLKRAIGQGQAYVDYLRGDEDYKRRWGAKPHVVCRFTVVPNRVIPQARQRLVDFGRSLKSLVRTN